MIVKEGIVVNKMNDVANGSQTWLHIGKAWGVKKNADA